MMFSSNDRETKRKMKTRMLISICVASILAVCGRARAEIPEYIHFQGVLTDDEGLPVNDTVSMAFSLYSDTTAAADWSVTIPDLIVTNGFYEAYLNPAVLDFDVLYYLGISVGGTQIGSRKPLASVPYSMRSAKTKVVPGAGLAGTSDSALVQLSIANAGVTSSMLGDSAVTTASIQEGAVTKAKIGAGQVVTSLNGLTDDVKLVEGNNVTITTAGDSIQISAAGGAGGDTAWVITGDSMHAAVSGNVGIGTDSPTGALHLKGSGDESLIIETEDNSAKVSLKLESPSSQDNEAEFTKWSLNAAGTIDGSILKKNLTEISTGEDAGPLMMRVVDDTCMYFLTDNVERMRITSGGRIGIGTDSPSHMLSVGHSVHINGSCQIEGGLNLAEELTVEGGVNLDEGVSIYFGVESMYFDPVATQRFGLTDGLALEGPLTVGSPDHWLINFPFTVFSDTMIDIGAIAPDIDSTGDVYIQEDLQVGQSIWTGQNIDAGGHLYTTGDIYAGNNLIVGNEAAGDLRILFGAAADESLYWNASGSRFQVSGNIAIDGTIHGGSIGPTYGDTLSYSFLVYNSSLPQGGDMNSSGDLFLGADLEVRQDIFYSGSLTDIAPAPLMMKNGSSTEISAMQAADALDAFNPKLFRYSETEGGTSRVEKSKIGFDPAELPDLVTSPDKKSYRPMDIVALLTRVVKQQRSDLEKQEMELNEQRDQLAAMEKRINALENEH